VVVPGNYDDQPARRAEQGQGSDAAGCERINMDDNAFPRTGLRGDVDRRPVHFHLPMR
jgi:hypothetical protein